MTRTSWSIPSKRASAVTALAAALIIFGGCSADRGSNEQAGPGVVAPDVAAPGDHGVEQRDALSALESLAMSTTGEAGGESAGDASADGTSGNDRAADTDRSGEQAVISTGTVSLRSDDVGRTRFEVQKRVDTLDGTIGDEETTTDRDGDIDTSRLVILVPQDRFDEAMTDLAGLANLAGTTRTAEDVTTQVIDNAARIRAQEKSLQRIEVLLARAREISEIVRIESELTQRQATLDSLRAQQAWLADQTSLSTITVHIEHTSTPAEDPDQDRNPFVAGLIGGWNVLGDFGATVALTAGALLPFAAAALLLAWPARLLWRRFRPAGRTARTPSAA